MPSLNWIGKDAVVRHHEDVPYRLLEPDPALSCGGANGDGSDTGNLIVQGDNLHALKALLPRYAGQVKCIYIDPPYNTGNEGWAYNDNVNSPEIRRWLGEVVGKEGETLDRHDRWLCMMYPRLMLLRKFLRDDGVIFVSIDDSELDHARIVLKEIFGSRNFVGTLVWKNATDNNPTRIVPEHEYVLCFARAIDSLEKVWKASTISSKERMLEIERELLSNSGSQQERDGSFRSWLKDNKPYIWPFQDYKFIDEHGIYTGIRGVHNPGKEGYRYDVLHPVTGRPCKEPLMGYRFPETTMKRLVSEHRIIFGDDETKIIELKVYLRDYQAKLSSVYELDGRAGTNEVKSIFPEARRTFDFPKSVQLVQDLISFGSVQDSLVVDSFAGSGTTAHAVLKQNANDGGNRRFILVEMDDSIARNVTAERVRRVAQGYTNAKGEQVEGLGGGFQFCRLSEKPLFDAGGEVRADVQFAALAEFVWFSETGSGRPSEASAVADLPSAQASPARGIARKSYGEFGSSPLLGTHEGRAIYLLYNGILRDRSVGGGNVLTSAVLELLEPFDGPRVIYAAACRLGAPRLAREGIVFKQTPYALDVSR